MPDYFHQAIAQMMYEELLFSRLVVALAPSGLEHQPTERKRRVVEERNPAWYRELCWLYQSNGRSRPRKKKMGIPSSSEATRFGHCWNWRRVAASRSTRIGCGRLWSVRRGDFGNGIIEETSMGTFIFLILALFFLGVSWLLTDEVERLGKIAEQDEGETL